MQPRHPERPERLTEVLSHFQRVGLHAEMHHRQAPLVSAQQVSRVHDADYLELLERLSPEEGLQQLEPDTALCADSLEATRRAAGAVCDATKAVCTGQDNRAFCAVRPPGHHAESNAGMGFCLYNSIAIAAVTALEEHGLDRVAIVDFDVHHGNGTVEIFADDPRVIVCSSYQHPFYPNRQHDVERDHIVHTPLPEGTTGTQFRHAVESSWFAKLEAFAPELYLVSAGFDAHRLDPLGGLLLTEDDFSWITHEISLLANRSARGRIVSALEGGYDLTALASSAAAHVSALL